MTDTPLTFRHSPSLQSVVDSAVESTLRSFSSIQLKPDELAISLVDLRSPTNLSRASHRGSERTYPASIIKLFYLEAAHRWLEDSLIQPSDELRRAMRDMIVDSSNDATHYIIDLITATTSGVELSGAEMDEWAEKRNVINRYFASHGYDGINVNQKPWNDGPFGRERVFMGQNGSNRNALTTDATARLLSEIALGKCVSQTRSLEMLELMKRDLSVPRNGEDDQTHDFTGPAVPCGGKLWSKAGWTSQTRHDAALIELPNGDRFILVIFTVNHATDREIIPTIARAIIATMASEREAADPGGIVSH